MVAVNAKLSASEAFAGRNDERRAARAACRRAAVAPSGRRLPLGAGGRDRRREPPEPPEERNLLKERRQLRHLALDERSVAAGKREEALAHDHDAVGPGHASKRGHTAESARSSAAASDDPVTSPICRTVRPPGKGRAA